MECDSTAFFYEKFERYINSYDVLFTLNNFFLVVLTILLKLVGLRYSIEFNLILIIIDNSLPFKNIFEFRS